MSDVDLVKDKIDVVELVREYVDLKAAGVNQKGLCPFHGEKTPSFMVSSERQSWHCFGCNKGGDIFTFIQDIEGMEFVEALKFLAKKAGVQLSNQFSGKNSGLKSRIKEINEAAASFFYNMLIKMDVSAGARDYLKNRGITEETIDSWKIGFGPEQWDLLTKYLLKKGHSIDDLVESGLTIKRDNSDRESGRGFYDRFRGRIMFPITDVHGAVVGFTGRVLIETEKSGGKYVNTPQTVVFDKSRVIFGLSKAKKAIREKDFIVITEGQTDVISSHQAGMETAVASSGTALTEHHITLLKRYSNNLRVAFDTDTAGQKAAKRGIDLAMAQGMHVKMIRIPEGKGADPDECIKKDRQVWFDAIENAQDIMEWYIDKGFSGKAVSDPRQKQEIVDEILPEIALIPYAVERDHWLQVVANRLHIDIETLREDLKRIQAQSRAKVSKPEVHTDVAAVKIIKKEEKTKIEKLVDRLFALLFKFPKIQAADWWKGIEHSLSTGNYAPLYEWIKDEYTKNNSYDLEQFSVSGDFLEVLDKSRLQGDFLFSNFSDSQAEKELKIIVDRIHAEWLKKERVRIQYDIEIAENAGEKEKVHELLNQFQKLT